MTLKVSFFFLLYVHKHCIDTEKSTAELHLTKENPGWEIRLALFVITELFTNPGLLLRQEQGGTRIQLFCCCCCKTTCLQSLIFNPVLSQKVDLRPVGSAESRLDGFLKIHRLYSWNTPHCRCVVSLQQQQCFAKLQSEMNQLARPPACQPSHPAKTNDRGPLLFLHNSSYTSSFNITSHKYTQDKSEEGGVHPISPFGVNDKNNFKLGLNLNSFSLQYLDTFVLVYSTNVDTSVQFGREMKAQKTREDRKKGWLLLVSVKIFLY